MANSSRLLWHKSGMKNLSTHCKISSVKQVTSEVSEAAAKLSERTIDPRGTIVWHSRVSILHSDQDWVTLPLLQILDLQPRL